MKGACLFLFVAFAATAFAQEDGIVSRIPRKPVDSSAIAAIGYSKRLHTLEIEFRNGAIYRYLDVPIATYNDLLTADSKARFYDHNIRGHYHSLHVRPHSE
jgi:hypothetical protein